MTNMHELQSLENTTGKNGTTDWKHLVLPTSVFMEIFGIINTILQGIILLFIISRNVFLLINVLFIYWSKTFMCL